MMLVLMVLSAKVVLSIHGDYHQMRGRGIVVGYRELEVSPLCHPPRLQGLSFCPIALPWPSAKFHLRRVRTSPRSLFAPVPAPPPSWLPPAVDSPPRSAASSHRIRLMMAEPPLSAQGSPTSSQDRRLAHFVVYSALLSSALPSHAQMRFLSGVARMGNLSFPRHQL